MQILLDGSAPDRVLLEVHNEGAIDADALPAIFEPLRPIEGSQKRQGSSGLGLGLYITQQIVVAHGGMIRVESNAASGTRFIVELPRESAAQSARVFDASAAESAY